MAKKTTLNLLSQELDALRERLLSIEENVEEALRPAVEKVGLRMAGVPEVTPALRRELIRELAEQKATRWGSRDDLRNWLQAEAEVDLILRRLGLEAKC